MPMNTNHYVEIDNTIRICVGPNKTRKPLKEHPNYIVAIIKKKESNAHNIIKERYNEALKHAQLKIRGI